LKNKLKGILSIILMSISFFMLYSPGHYMRAAGDYILEFIGLKAWTQGNYGFHLTFLYFGIFFILSLFLVKKYAIDIFNIKKRSIFIVFVGLVVIFSFSTQLLIKNIQKNSSGLLAIGYNPEGSNMHYEYKNYKLVNFIAEFQLTNYSKDKKTFFISIDSPFYRKDGVDEISFYTPDGKQAIFQLGGNETKSFLLSLDDYNIIGGKLRDNGKGSGSGIIQEIILTSNDGNKVKLYYNDILGRKLN